MINIVGLELRWPIGGGHFLDSVHGRRFGHILGLAT